MRTDHGATRSLWKPGPRLRGWVSAALDVAWPRTTLDDDAPSAGSGWSGAAWAKVRFLEAPWCETCGAPFEHGRGDGARCLPCETEPPAFDRARAACLYDEASRELVLQFKHGDRLEHARLFAGWLSRAARELIADSDVIVPVPLHRSRLLKRRYNQAAEIARPLSRLTGLSCLPDALIRAKPGGQAGRSASGRRREVQGAFAVPPSKRPLVEGRRILLVDDVMTTGATAEACARALKRAGAAAVQVAVVARVPDPRDGAI